MFTNTIKALYPQATDLKEEELEKTKETWLQRFKSDGFYIIEALPESQVHEITKKQRQERIGQALLWLIQKVKDFVTSATRIILIKSNMYDIAAEPFKQAGFTILNTELVDYPGHFNQRAYREKLAALIKRI